MMRPYAHAMAVGHAAHGAEIVLKTFEPKLTRHRADNLQIPE
jgi:hypothetical protein